MKGYVYLRGLRAARLDAGYEPEDLAQRFGYTKNSVLRWERLERRVHKDLVPQLAAMLGATEDALFNRREPLSKGSTGPGRPKGSMKRQPTFEESGKAYAPRQDHLVRNHMERLRRERRKIECPSSGCMTKSRRSTSYWPYCERHQDEARSDSRRLA